MEILNKIIDKLFSGKFALLILVGSTYSLLLFCVSFLVFKGKIEGDKLIGLIGGVSAVLVMMWKDFVHANGDGKESTPSEIAPPKAPVVPIKPNSEEVKT